MAISLGLLVTFLVFLFHSQYAKSNYLLSDSADYRRAANTPFLQLYLNTDSASPLELYQMRHSPDFRSHPWDYLYFSNDNAAIRHFHTPVSFYAMHAVSLVSSADTGQRKLTSLVTALTCGVVVVGLFAFGLPLPVAALLGLVAGIQSRNTEVSVDPSPHSWYMLFAVLFLFAFARYFRTHEFRTLAVAAVFLGCAFATLEFSLELILVCLRCRRCPLDCRSKRSGRFEDAGDLLRESDTYLSADHFHSVARRLDSRRIPGMLRCYRFHIGVQEQGGVR